ncbi:MAG: polysaccharide biosynthesis/export family protein [Candidatus Sulfotelmatobacter sp.]|jgi:polysaccharide export outer membrane protein
MEFGRSFFARSGSLLALGALSMLSLASNSAAQQAPPAPSSESGVPASSAAQPVPQTATGGSANRAAKPADNSSAANSGKTTDQPSSSLRLGAGDLIEVGVYNVPELSTKARIGNSGDVYLPLIDYVHVADLTVEEAQALIEKRLDDGGFVRNAHVTIFLDESANQGVTVIGEVTKPGVYPLLGDRKLYDLISAAGGFSQSAGRKVSIIRPHDPSSPITVSLPRNLADDLQDNIEILPGDTINVPKAPIVYVVGDVGRPAGLLIDNGTLTVLQALALAGGTNHTAKLGRVCIIRKGPAGMTETRIPLKKMLEAKAPDVTMQADDILFVPLSGVRVAAAQGMSAAISAATGIAVLAAHP